MDRKLFGIFSGWQVTTMFGIAVLAPTALFGAVATQAVSITNPSSGVMAQVDPSGRLHVYDGISSYRNNPANLVAVSVANSGTSCSALYAVPSGKVLVITGINGFVSGQPGGGKTSSVSIYDGPNCKGSVIASQAQNLSSSTSAAPLIFNLGSGIPVIGGRMVSVASGNDFGSTFVEGYLVPTSAIPAP